MRLAFCLSYYFPHGGMQRDFMRIAEQCHQWGHEINVYTTYWKDPCPSWISLHLIYPTASSNHDRIQQFSVEALRHIDAQNYDNVIGFTRMPGLDFYFAADSCFVAKQQYKRFPLVKTFARYKLYAKMERAVFGLLSRTKILSISRSEKQKYQAFYGTPNSRFYDLPPGVDYNRQRAANSAKVRQHYRQQFEVNDGDFVVLSIGSSYHTKGIDRNVKAFAALPDGIRNSSQLWVVGHEKKQARYVLLAKKLGIDDRVKFLGVRYDIPELLWSADLLLHSARMENTGTAIVEAIVAELPVLCTRNCGYAHYVTDAKAGQCVDMPFRQAVLNQMLRDALSRGALEAYAQNAKGYTSTHDLHGLIEQAASVIVGRK